MTVFSWYITSIYPSVLYSCTFCSWGITPIYPSLLYNRSLPYCCLLATIPVLSYHCTYVSFMRCVVLFYYDCLCVIVLYVCVLDVLVHNRNPNRMLRGVIGRIRFRLPLFHNRNPNRLLRRVIGRIRFRF